MSWQLGALLVIGLALAGGFAWYERSRPDARIVALVATLAAFAALGRIAFAAIPNVKPTTDIVLIAGYALGPAPGFMVGAAAGLASNFFFGQGPWTPWQMAGWGLTGLIGAGVGRATGRHIGRWPLAVTCLVVGFGFTALQDVGDWVNFSDHSTGQLGVYAGKGIGFDVVHAVGCLFFALAFGPALIRSLARFATRLQVTWSGAGRAALPLLLAVVVLVVNQAEPQTGVAQAAGDPTTYLLSAQNADGGFGPAPGQASTELYSGWAALGLAAEGYNPGQVARGGRSLLAYLRAGAVVPGDPGAIERSILAATASGADPRSFGGHDLAAALRAATGRDGAVSDQTNLTAFAVLALRGAGAAVAPKTLAWLVAQQDPDGGFNFATAGAGSDIDDTGAVLEALAGYRGSAAARARRRAVKFIAVHQNRDGGFPSSPPSDSNSQSTAWAVQGLIAAGAGEPTLRRATRYLKSLIAPDGHIRYSRSEDQTPVWVTAEAVMALAGKALPLRPLVSLHSHVRTPAAAPPSRRSKPAGAHVRPTAIALQPGAKSGPVLRLAADAGVLDALVLAPIGLG